MNDKKYVEVNALISECEEEIVDYDFDLQRSFIVKAVPTEYIENFPAADVAEVRHGYWVRPNPYCKPFCSECKTFEQSGEKKKYCSECGAKMDGDAK